MEDQEGINCENAQERAFREVGTRQINIVQRRQGSRAAAAAWKRL